MAKPILENLLSSRVRARLLTTFFLSPGAEKNAWELAQSLKENYSPVWKELNRLENLGILTSQPKGNSKAYRVDPTCPILSELRSIIIKTEGIGGVIRTKLGGLERVKAAFIYGSFVTGEADSRSDIDLMVIGEVDLEAFATLIADAEADLNRPINYVIFSDIEWHEKRDREEPFVMNVYHSPKIMLVGAENAL